MDRARDDDYGLSIMNQLIPLSIAGNFAWIGQTSLDGFILFQASDILGRADKDRDHSATQCRCAYGLDLNAIARLVQTCEVIGDLFPVGDGAILARVEAQHRAWRRN